MPLLDHTSNVRATAFSLCHGGHVTNRQGGYELSIGTPPLYEDQKASRARISGFFLYFFQETKALLVNTRTESLLVTSPDYTAITFLGQKANRPAPKSNPICLPQC